MSGNKNEDRPVLVRRRLALYEDETRQLLLRACEWADHLDEETRMLSRSITGDNTIPVFPKKDSPALVSDVDSDEQDDSESSTNEDEDESVNNSDSDSDELEDNDTSNSSKPDSSVPTTANETAKTGGKPDKLAKASGKFQKRLAQDIHRHADNLIRIDLPLPPDNGDNDKLNKDNNDANLHLFPAAALLPKIALREPVSVSNQAHIVKALSDQLSSPNDDGLVVVLLIQSGRFAGGVFRRGKCLAQKTSVRYTIRKGQGKAQSTQDGSRRPKSVGSSLRRAGEEQLKLDIKTTLAKWSEMGYIQNASLIFLACPKTMQSTVFAAADAKSTKTNNNNSANDLLSKDDERIRKIPFDVGRATFHNVEIVHEVLMGVDLCHVQKHGSSTKENDSRNETSGSAANDTTQTREVVVHDPEEEKRKRKEELASDLPMTPLHIASRDGKLTELLDLLHKSSHSAEEDEEYLDFDQPAGYDCMTPLHFAASASTKVDPVTAAALVSALLVQAHADPTIVDACNRPPYFLAKHDKVREAFRKARAVLGEDYCDWDGGAKVGPALTEDDLEAKKEREAEKKRRKKARQKEKKAKARAAAEEAEKLRAAEEEAKQAKAEAKRVRDGLSAKPTGANVCDFCNKVCKGRDASKNMFQRLEYKYCSVDCVNKHKRELMAAAAMARFGG